MSEILNEEELDYLKGDVKRIVCESTEHEVIALVEGLIAKVDSLKKLEVVKRGKDG